MISLLLLALVVLLGLSAFFSGSETALFSLDPMALEKLKQKKPARGSTIFRLLDRPQRLLISIVLGNMLVNILASTLAERSSARLFSGGAFHWIFSTVVMTFLILVLGEIVPKTLAIKRAEKVSLKIAPWISIVEVLVMPLRAAVRFVSDRVLGLLGGGKPSSEPPLTKEELATAIELGTYEGTLNGDEKEMISEIFELGDKIVRQLMTPRNEIVSFEVDTPLKKVTAVIKEKDYSRIPIYAGKAENVIGFLYPKDLIMARARGAEKIELGSYLRQPYYVPETMKASRLLKEFLDRKIHIALVVDEYGGLAGLIALDDLIEEIVGEIRERGEVRHDYEKLNDDAIKLRGRTELDYIKDEFGLELFSEENVTLSGYLCERIGRLSKPGDVHEEGEVRFEVLTMKGNRIGQVMVGKPGIGKSPATQTKG